MDADAVTPPDPAAPLLESVDLAVRNVAAGGGPFDALVVTAEGLRFPGVNRVTAENGPTEHAEVMAIRAACRRNY